MALYILESKILQTIIAFILLYYIWMDITLYYKIQAMPVSNGKSTSTETSSSSPLSYVTMKALLLDHTTHYIHTPLSIVCDQVTHFSEVFTFITPNMISFSHVIVAFIGMKLLWSDSLSTRQIGVLLFELRSFLDAFDGTVARGRTHSSLKELEVGSIGYLVDGVCDALGCVALFLGCLGILHGKPPHYVPLPMTLSNKNGSGSSENATRKRAYILVLCSAVQMILSSLFWNKTLSNYHDLLEVSCNTQAQRVLQNKIFKSNSLWTTVWFWKLSNPHAMMEMILISIFIDKLWNFLNWMQYLGFFILLIQVSITETHLHYVQEILHMSGVNVTLADSS